MRSHIEVQDRTPAQFHDNEYIKDTESGCECHEKVARGLGMIVHKGQPSLTRTRRPTSMTSQIPLDRAGENPDSRLQVQLVRDALLNQVRFSAAICINSQSSCGSVDTLIQTQNHHESQLS
jgi:hypothetical protein